MTYRNDISAKTVLILTTLLLAAIYSSVQAASEKLSPSLQSGQPLMGKVRVVAFLNPSPNQAFHKTLTMVGDVRAKENHAQLIKELQHVSGESLSFKDYLQKLSESGQVSDIKSYWITDAVSFTVDRGLLDSISERPELNYLVEDLPLELVAPVSTETSTSGLAGSPNYMAITGVRELWNRGYTGHGRLVSNFDTGVDGTHPALVANWLGARGGTETQSWFDPYGTTSPTDLNGHGTHTMGIIAGRDGADTIGVAFNANWIAAGVVDRGQSLSKTVSDIIAAFQWAADPDGNPETVDDLPDVVSNSWGIPRGLFAPCDQTFYQAIDNLEALGVVVVFACGNEGPNAGTIRNPADRTSSPTNSFSVGAVDQNQIDLPVAPFSSRGPATCDTTKIKPEIMAPGVSIRSSYKGDYRLMSGTSMAAPFVAGCVALMREYNPEATVEQIKMALINSASDLGAPGKDNDYGWGFINVARAVDLLPQPRKPRISIAGIQLAQSNDGIFSEGATTPLELTLVDSIVASGDFRADLHCSDSHVFILTDTASFGAASVGGLTDNLGRPFMIKLDHFVAPGTSISFSVDFYSRVMGYLNSADFSLTVDQPVTARAANLHTDRLNFEVTNFGVSRRMYDASAGSNLLSQLSFMIADSLGVVYDALPGNIDYFAADTMTSEVYGDATSLSAQFRTRDAAFTISQKATVYQGPADAGYVLLDFKVGEGLATSFTRCYLALGLDVDFADGETVITDGSDFVFRSGSYNRYVGVRLLPHGISYGQEIAGSTYKNGSLNDPQKYGLISAGSTRLSAGIGDNALVVGVGPMDIPSSGVIEMAAIIASGNSLDEIRLSLQRGENRYNTATSVDGGEGGNLPTAFTLDQNYPNPFNAETAISFSLPTAGNCRFEIVDILGRTVRSIDLPALPAGHRTVTWDAKDNFGNEVASGIYFYRVNFGGSSQVRKMVLLK